MGLIDEKAATYYSGELLSSFAWTPGNDTLSITSVNGQDFDTKLVTEGQLPNFKIYVNKTQTSAGNGGTWIPYTGTTTVDQYNVVSLSPAIQTGILYSLTAGGNGYAAASGVPTLGGSGTGMTVTISETGGVVDSVIIDSLGDEQYQDGDIINIDAGNGAARFTISQFAPYTGWKIVLNPLSKWDNYGNYAYITINDIVNNFMVGYVGEGKLIKNINRADVIFHAKRGLQEFSYDTLKSVKSTELTVPSNLSVIIPQDYVNYVQLSWVDRSGVKHPIYENHLTSNPKYPLLQDGSGEPVQDEYGDNIETDSITDNRWRSTDTDQIYGPLNSPEYEANVWNDPWWQWQWGQRYGQKGQYANFNGWFTINEREGKFSFSSNLIESIIILEYISDGLAYDLDTKVPKMAEQAMYMHIAHAILSTRFGVQEYTVRRFKKERSAALRNAKIRLQNIKLKTFIQQMRGQAKWIKH